MIVTHTIVMQDAEQWLDAALRSLPTQRADGVVTVTEHQMIRFKHAIRSLRSIPTVGSAVNLTFTGSFQSACPIPLIK